MADNEHTIRSDASGGSSAYAMRVIVCASAAGAFRKAAAPSLASSEEPRPMFDDFQARLGISRNILNQRLTYFVDNGIV